MNEQVTIVIVSYNCREALSQCLHKLTAQGDSPPIIVVDNASTDNTADMVARDFPNVQLIKNAINRGFAVASNQGIRACATPFVIWVPNPSMKS